MDYFVTRYALSNAGLPTIVSSENKPGDDGFVWLRMPKHAFGTTFKLGRNVFLSKDDADAAIRADRDKKIKSLEKQIAKLRLIG